MRNLIAFFTNPIMQSILSAWFIAQVLKILIELFIKKRVDFKRLLGSGGMPSSHSSFVTSLATSVGFVEGFSSTIFIVCIAFALVVMYDAAGVRRAAGQQAKILNNIIASWDKSPFEERTKKLKELLGHTPVEVFAGAILGIVVAMSVNM